MATAVLELCDLDFSDLLVRDAMRELMVAHWTETEKVVEPLSPSPAWDLYVRLQQTEDLIAVGARIDGVLVGYSVAFRMRQAHYDRVVCYHDALFVARSNRASRIGGRLIAQTQLRARLLGCEQFFWHAKPGSALDIALGRRLPIEEHVYREAL